MKNSTVEENLTSNLGVKSSLLLELLGKDLWLIRADANYDNSLLLSSSCLHSYCLAAHTKWSSQQQ